MSRVVRYNWPKYLGALLLIAAGLAVPSAPVRLATAAFALWLGAGLAVTWRVYDRSALYRWTWCTALLPDAPARYTVLSTGLDEISARLATCWPDAAPTIVDLYDPAITGEPSVRRARAHVPPPPDAIAGRLWDLPVPSGSQDAVFMAFAIHELRHRAQRLALFAELRRILRTGGRVVLVEHCRDAANIAAYGPGAWHFYPRGEWLRLAGTAGLQLVAETTMTPFVRALVLQR
jgi:SAM-dependent methyltransferase